jgi:hypothetical protein
MLTYNMASMFTRSATALLCTVLLFGCQNGGGEKPVQAPLRMKDVPAIRLNFRYEADVPTPTLDQQSSRSEERNAAVQSDFDANRPLELLDRTITSFDKKYVAAVYHRISDVPSEFRLDMYSSDGKLLRKLTSDAMAVHFPETIVWSPDSGSLAYVAMLRVNPIETAPVQGAAPVPAPEDLPPAGVDPNSNTAADPALPTPTPVPAATPLAPTGILTFRSEQLYICAADGTGIKPVTQNEGLIYFYYAWSPDSSMLAALATTAREWRYLEVVSNSKNEQMVPQGRPRLIEKNGRERRLDDNLTAVHPVWSPDSSKIAAAFENQIRIYDALGNNTTQAAIPLRNQLLISSQAYDRDQQKKLQAANTDGTIPEATPDQPLSTLPDEKSLVSYNPIVELAWTADDLLYFQTAYLRRMKIEADSVRSFSRWHRLALSAQVPQQIANKP